jgi:hypothetical protein
MALRRRYIGLKAGRLKTVPSNMRNDTNGINHSASMIKDALSRAMMIAWFVRRAL